MENPVKRKNHGEGVPYMSGDTIGLPLIPLIPPFLGLSYKGIYRGFVHI